MALAYKILAMGERAPINAAANLDVKTGIAAAGTTQGTATALDNALNFLGTVASGAGVKLSVNAAGGDSMFVYNGGANAVKVYPQSGAQINALGANNPMILAANTGAAFYAASTTLWGALLSA